MLIVLALLPTLLHAGDAPLQPLTATELRSYAYPTTYEQPAWDRRDFSSSTLHTLLQRAAQIHQEGDLDKAVQVLKQLLRQEPNHPEAYMALAKALNDQGKYDLAAKASAKATRIQNDRLAEWSLV